jgi:hypothetical protein
MRKPRHIVVLALASMAAALALVTSALADQTFHTLHAQLSPVGGAPLHSGWVNDIHANGPINGAHEVYHLDGASPNTTYQVVIVFYANDTTCSGVPGDFPTTTLTTNAAGNANATFNFAAGPPVVPPSHNSAVWELRIGDQNGVAAYATDCEVVIID